MIGSYKGTPLARFCQILWVTILSISAEFLHVFFSVVLTKSCGCDEYLQPAVGFGIWLSLILVGLLGYVAIRQSTKYIFELEDYDIDKVLSIKLAWIYKLPIKLSELREELAAKAIYESNQKVMEMYKKADEEKRRMQNQHEKAVATRASYGIPDRSMRNSESQTDPDLVEAQRIVEEITQPDYFPLK